MAVKNAVSSDHPNVQREIQTFEIDQTQVPEVWAIEVIGPFNTDTDGMFFLTFTNSEGTQFNTENNFEWTITGASLAGELYWDYYRYVGSGISITKTLYDENDVVTTDFNSAERMTFEVKVERRMNDPSFVDVTATVFNSAATINLYFPTGEPVIDGGYDPAVEGSDQLEGYFTITCTDPDDNLPYTTQNIGWW